MWKPSWEKRLAIRLFDATSPIWRWAIKSNGAADPTAPERITVLAFWGIGDAILLTPLLRALKRRHPNATIELIGKPFLRDIFAHDRCVDEITVYAPPWTAPTGKYRFWSRKYINLIRWLAKRRSKKSDWIVTTRGDIREHILAACAGARRRFGYGEGGGRALLTDSFPIARPTRRDLHFADCAMEIAGFLDCPDDGDGPSIALLEQERQHALDFLRSTGWRGEHPILGVHLGAGAPIRRWPVERVQRVLEQARNDIGWLVILGDPDLDWRRLKVPQWIGHSAFSGPLREVLALLSHLDVLLCNDGGIMHAAAALGVPVVAVFGPGNPHWFHPYGEGHRIVMESDMPCRPCHDRCIHDTPLCMESVSVQQVANALLKTLGENAACRKMETSQTALLVKG